MSTDRYEEAKEELKKTMTIKMMKKKEQVTMKLQRKAQQETATLVQKHAQQMLELLQSKQDELQKELEEEILVSTGSYLCQTPTVVQRRKLGRANPCKTD